MAGRSNKMIKQDKNIIEIYADPIKSVQLLSEMFHAAGYIHDSSGVKQDNQLTIRSD